MNPKTVNEILFWVGIGVLLLIPVAAWLHEHLERRAAQRKDECNFKLAELAVEMMWHRVNDKGLVGADQAIFVCASLTEIQTKYGCHPMANVCLTDSNGSPKFITVGSK